MIKVKIKKEHLEKSKAAMKDLNDFYPELSDIFQKGNPLAFALLDMGYKDVHNGLSSVAIGRDRYAIRDEPDKAEEEGPVSRSFKSWIKNFNWTLTKDIELLPRWIIKEI